MEIAYYLLVIIIAGILLGIGALSKASGKRKKLLWVGLVVLIAGIIVAVVYPTSVISNASGTWSFFAVSGAGYVTPPPANTGGTIDVTGCSVTDSQTITLSATDKYTNGATGGTHRYSLNGAPALTVSDAGTLTAYVGNTIKVLWMNESKTSYFSEPDTYQVTCNGPRTFYAKLANNGTLTSTLKDNTGVVIDQVNNQTLGVGDVKDVEITLSGQYQKDYPYGFVGVVDYNKTCIDDVVLTMGGDAFGTATIPQSDSIAYSSESNTKGYEIPGVFSNDDVVFKATIDADDTLNPTVDGSDVLIRLYPKNYYINDNTGGTYDGPSAQDEDNAVTRTGHETVTIHVD